MSWISRIWSGGAGDDQAIGALVGDHFVAQRGTGGGRRDAHRAAVSPSSDWRRSGDPHLRRHQLIDLGREFGGKRQLERDDHDGLPVHAAHVEVRRLSRVKRSNVVSVVGDDNGVIGRKRRDQAVVRNHRLDHADHGSGVNILKPHHPRDVLVALASAGICEWVSGADERTLRAGTILMIWPAGPW